MYNLFAYFDKNYADHRSIILYVDNPDKFWFGNYPDKNAALEEIKKCKTLNRYNLDAGFKQDLLHIENTIKNCAIDENTLQEFYDFTDILDGSRNHTLKEYLPALDALRRKPCLQIRQN
jgi:hypothetical protein